MLRKTHIVISVASLFYFIPYINNKIIFSITLLIATLIPDIDTNFSEIGKRKIFRPIQWIFSHRGVIHSYTFCIFASLVLAYFYPILALPFFLGFSFHLFADSFTVSGIRPFWPLKFISQGPVKTGSIIEKTIFITFIFIDVFLGFFAFAKIFLN